MDEIERLEEILGEMMDLNREALELVGSADPHPCSGITDRARSYWFNQIRGVLGDEDILGGSMCTMQNTIDELKEQIEGEED